MYIWIKINDTLGYSGISKGQSEKDVDNHMSNEEIDSLFKGTRVIELLEDNPIANVIPDGFVEYMESIGWKEESDMFRASPYGFVLGFCFSKQEVNHEPDII